MLDYLWLYLIAVTAFPLLARLRRDYLRRQRLLDLEKKPERAAVLADALTQGYWTHDYPISVEQARGMGLPISTEMPAEIYELMALYPQQGKRRPSVEYVPAPYAPQPEGSGREADPR